MARNQVLYSHYNSDDILYFTVSTLDAAIWNGSSFESYLTANYATYDVLMILMGTASNKYKGTFPSAITAGKYFVEVRVRAGVSPLETDDIVASGEYSWDGEDFVDIDMDIDGKPIQSAIRYIAAVLAGKLPTGAGSNTETYLGLDGSTERVTVTTDVNGNRTAIDYDP